MDAGSGPDIGDGSQRASAGYFHKPGRRDRHAAFERRRLSMRPGITCLWQVNGRNGIGLDAWVKLDLEYIDSWALTRDFEILLKTIPAVLRGTGAS